MAMEVRLQALENWHSLSAPMDFHEQGHSHLIDEFTRGASPKESAKGVTFVEGIFRFCL